MFVMFFRSSSLRTPLPDGCKAKTEIIMGPTSSSCKLSHNVERYFGVRNKLNFLI